MKVWRKFRVWSRFSFHTQPAPRKSRVPAVPPAEVCLWRDGDGPTMLWVDSLDLWGATCSGLWFWGHCFLMFSFRSSLEGWQFWVILKRASRVCHCPYVWMRFPPKTAGLWSRRTDHCMSPTDEPSDVLNVISSQGSTHVFEDCSGLKSKILDIRHPLLRLNAATSVVIGQSLG